jgi:hypothetical protein
MLCLQKKEVLEAKFSKRHEIAQFILEYLYDLSNKNPVEEETNKEEALVEFSVFELKEAYERRYLLINAKAGSEDIEDALFYLARIEALKIEGGFLFCIML